MSRTLIEKLEEAAVGGDEAERGWKYVLLASARDIIRAHLAEQSQDAVERVRKAIANKMPLLDEWTHNELAKAAIAAMPGLLVENVCENSAELPEPEHPASEAYRQVEEAGRATHDLNRVLEAALKAGFSLDTSYGEGEDRRQPVSDLRTLCRFIEALATVPTLTPQAEKWAAELSRGKEIAAWAWHELTQDDGFFATDELAARIDGAIEEGKRQPKGWRLVPTEITPEMQRAYFDVIDKNLPRVETDAMFGRFSSNWEAYRAMLAVAPAPPEREVAAPVNRVKMHDDERYWLIVFEEAGKPFESFTDEDAARRRWKELLPNWNCHLFTQINDLREAAPSERESSGFVLKQLEDALGCFNAAIAEGLYERLVEQEPELGNLRDLIERRVLVAQSHIMAAIDAINQNTTSIEGEKP